eukprot:jgi/Mesen1/7627/ME000004S07894
MATVLARGLTLTSAYSVYASGAARNNTPPCTSLGFKQTSFVQGKALQQIFSRKNVCRWQAASSPFAALGVAVGEVEAGQIAPSSEVPVLPFRVGHGFDLHRLEPNLPLIIGGVDIPHDRGCEAHSDGDVLMHCVVDAILGALGLPDIGQLFPDNDPKWKGAASHVFLTEAVRRMHEAGYTIGNLDSTIILQRPKLSPHKDAIKENLCALLQAPKEVVNIKAKTHEKVDSLGENRSVACHTVVLLMRK